MRSRARRRSADIPSHTFGVIATIAVIVAAWQVGTTFFGFGQPTLPPPNSVGKELLTNWSLYAEHTWVTIKESLIAFTISGVLGVLVASLIAYFSILQRTVYPVVLGLQVIPKVAIAPLLVLWFGFGMAPKIVLGVLVALFPIVIDSYAGLRSADKDAVDLVRALTRSKWQEYRRVRLPSSLPAIFTGLKVGVTLAVVGVVIGELSNAREGLGYLVNLGNGQFNTPMSFAAIVLLAGIGLVMYWLVCVAERILVPWGVAS